jgi:hypothetical protein
LHCIIKPQLNRSSKFKSSNIKPINLKAMREEQDSDWVRHLQIYIWYNLCKNALSILQDIFNPSSCIIPARARNTRHHIQSHKKFKSPVTLVSIVKKVELYEKVYTSVTKIQLIIRSILPAYIPNIILFVNKVCTPNNALSWSVSEMVIL